MNAEEVELLSDSKYRNYVAAVDKALKNFEYSSEWADLISALGKLNKVMIADRPRHEIHGSSLQVIEKAKRHTWGLNICKKKQAHQHLSALTHCCMYFTSQVLQNNAKYQVVPKKLTIGKRLAQCLHPALPSGVHRKALETYEIIFKIIGPKRLAKDLFLYR